MNRYAYNIRRIIGRRIAYMRGPSYKDKYYSSIYSVFMHWCEDIRGLSNDISIKKSEEFIENIEGKHDIVIPRVVISITDYCTLRCKECAAAIPYLKDRVCSDTEMVIKDIEKLLSNVDEMICIEFIGGEPLLHPELDKLIHYACKNDKIRMVELTTNATILPDKKLVDELKDDKVIIQISNYKNEVQKIDEFKELCSLNEIKLKILDMEKWYSYGNPIKKNRSRSELKYSYYYCNDSSMCRTVYDGKLFVCGRAAALYAMGKQIDDSSYLDIRNIELTGETIKKFFMEKQWANACDFCDASRDFLKVVAVAEQVDNKFN